MSDNELRTLIEHASQFAEVAFQEHGECAPIWHMITRNGEHMIELMPPCESKDDAVLLIRTLMEMQDVVRYVYFAEAWMLDHRGGPPTREQIEQWAREGLSKHPNRIEVVTFQAEDSEAGQMTGHRRIIRNSGKPKLGPLEIVETVESEGRMVGLLPKPKGRLQ